VLWGFGGLILEFMVGDGDGDGDGRGWAGLGRGGVPGVGLMDE
jgi:hypothetical protein